MRSSKKSNRSAEFIAVHAMRKNTALLRNDSTAPEYILFKNGTIYGHLEGLENPLTWEAICSNYQTVRTEDDVLLLRRKEHAEYEENERSLIRRDQQEASDGMTLTCPDGAFCRRTSRLFHRREAEGLLLPRRADHHHPPIQRRLIRLRHDCCPQHGIRICPHLLSSGPGEHRRLPVCGRQSDISNHHRILLQRLRHRLPQRHDHRGLVSVNHDSTLSIRKPVQ